MRIDQTLLEKNKGLCRSNKKQYQAFFKQLKKRPPKNLDLQFHQLHEEVFDQIDCLECANCCKTLGPIIREKDVERMASALKMKEVQFAEEYTRIDQDGDRVFKSMPCPFLAQDNYCTIYENRPKACREYPHTDRKKMVQILDLTFENMKTCPGVFEIVNQLKDKI